MSKFKNQIMLEQSIEEVMDSISDDPRAWAEMFLETKQSMENMVNLIEAYRQLMRPFVDESSRKKSSDLH